LAFALHPNPEIGTSCTGGAERRRLGRVRLLDENRGPHNEPSRVSGEMRGVVDQRIAAGRAGTSAAAIVAQRQYVSTANPAEKVFCTSKVDAYSYPAKRQRLPLTSPFERSRFMGFTMLDDYSRKHPDSGFKKSEWRQQLSTRVPRGCRGSQLSNKSTTQTKLDTYLFR
jgi:hypothetical protein